MKDLHILLALSGGLDSTVLLAKLLLDFPKENIHTVGFTYGSKHNLHENAAARQIATYYGVDFKLVNLLQFMSSFNSALMTGSDDPVPQGHYDEASMKATVVPGRNLIFASIMAGMAESFKYYKIMLGVHQGDHHIYPDCRPGFVHSLASVVEASTDYKVSVNAPFLHLNKRQIVKIGLDLNVPFGLTRTCYESKFKACGKCGSCQERLEAFHLNNASDPIEYESRELFPISNKTC